MPAPTTGVLDNFNRNDTAPLTGWSAAFGGYFSTWSARSSDGKAYQAAAANGQTAGAWTTTYAIPCEDYVTLSAIPANAKAFGLILTQGYATQAAFDGYGVEITFAAGNESWVLGRYDNAAFTSLDTYSAGVSAGEKISLRITSTALTSSHYTGGSWVDDVLSASAGLNYSGPFYPYMGTTDTGLNVLCDDFGGGVVNFDVSVSATPDELAITEYEPDINAEISISADADSLTITEYAATVNIDADISVSAESVALVVTEHAPDINAEISISASSDELTVTEYAANVGIDASVSVEAETDTLSLTANAADITYDIDITAALAALAITANTTAIGLDTSVAAQVAVLSMATHSPTVGIGSIINKQYPAVMEMYYRRK